MFSSGVQSTQLLVTETDELVDWAARTVEMASTPFAAAQRIVRRLGAQVVHSTHAQFGFWLPDIARNETSGAEVLLEVFTPLGDVDLTKDISRVRFRRERVPLAVKDEYAWGVLTGLQIGSREQVGSFYQVLWRLGVEAWRRHLDPLAHSLPFGAFAPAEVFDMRGMLAERKDAAYFDDLRTVVEADGVERVCGPVNILQLHVNTATRLGTFAGLSELYRTIARKVKQGEMLTPQEEVFVGYDAVQLMPIEPIIEYEEGPRFWQVSEDEGDEVEITLRRPDMSNWGYDVVIAGSPAVNPTTLQSGRPNEFLDFIEVLHQFPEQPIKVVLDVVYGHADNQALVLLHPLFFAGSNMYGQNLNYGHPVVRAILLEMQRRKGNYGVDGIRVDGAQDFKVWNSDLEILEHDDDFLRLVNDIELDVANRRYRPWMIFEDGRPWPQEDWELSSTYLEVTEQMPNVVQWGPLTFAHNTPFLVTFWISKWWRIKQIAEVGEAWVTGCANHDTLRRGTQVAPDARVNVRLGASLPDILLQAYDNPSARMFDYAFMPGVPMDFINANMRAPWSFIRNTDVRYAVKVVSEEARFLRWAVKDGDFARHFARLKGLGFVALDDLRHFMDALAHFVAIAGNDLAQIADMMGAVEPALPGPRPSATNLLDLARAWMDDVHDYCNVAEHTNRLNATQTAFDLALRNFRRARPWLRQNLRQTDTFDYWQPVEGAIVFYGLRRSPENREELLFVANMEGATCRLTPLALPIAGLAQDGWQPALQTPGLGDPPVRDPLTLADSAGVVFTRRPA